MTDAQHKSDTLEALREVYPGFAYLDDYWLNRLLSKVEESLGEALDESWEEHCRERWSDEDNENPNTNTNI